MRSKNKTCALETWQIPQKSDQQSCLNGHTLFLERVQARAKSDDKMARQALNERRQHSLLQQGLPQLHLCDLVIINKERYRHL